MTLKGTITRTHEAGDQGCQGTFGVLQVDGLSGTWFTGELPWRDNRPDVSRIPAGSYLCKLQFSPHFQRMLYHVLGVPDRGDVEIHNGNYCGDVTLGFKSDVEGCTILGNGIGELQPDGYPHSQAALLNSDVTLADFLKATGGQDIWLTYVDNFGNPS